MLRNDFLIETVRDMGGRLLASSGEEHSDFGFHIEFGDLYRTILYFTCIYIMGQFASRVLQMPSLVGEIFCGILMGPPLADYVPNAETLVLIGEVGLILLVIEAGIDIDMSVMKLVGTRGLMIAIVGSFLPIAVGVLVAWVIKVGDWKAIVASGSVFGPTSLGIALNVLKGGGVLNTPVGQMIIAAAVVDDMIALVILSQLEGLVGTITVTGILVPIVSALLFLIVGGYIAVFVLPNLINRYILPRFSEQSRDKVEMTGMFGLVLGLMPATNYAEASYLMGSFIAGLAFCHSDGLHHQFVRQFKRILQWLMRIFFSSTIGFQVPIKDFGDSTIIWQGLVFCLAWLVGKVAVGFMVPNFSQNKKFTGNHFRDCMVTGFSMAAEGEFAFVIAVFAVDKGLIEKELYASLVLAVLISTIIPPFALRFTISYYNKKGEEAVARAAEEEEQRDRSASLNIENGDDDLVVGIKNQTEVFLVIQTQSESTWGLLINIMGVLGSKGLDVIDHRAWSPRGINTTLVNEVYARSPIQVVASQTLQNALDALIEDITKAIKDVIDQSDSRVKVQRWFPGVVEEVVEETNEKQHKDIRQRLLKEASTALERKASIQISATKGKTIEEITGMNVDKPSGNTKDELTDLGSQSLLQSSTGKDQQKEKPRRRFRHKTHSTPVVGGGLFGEVEARSGRNENPRFHRVSDYSRRKQEDLNFSLKASGVPAEITIKGQVFQIRISQETWRDLQNGMEGQTRDSRGVPISGIEITAQDDAPVVQRLQGFVRNTGLQRIQEEASEYSEDSSIKGGIQ
jgi:Kef-type K+ transport system membrane component KefB